MKLPTATAPGMVVSFGDVFRSEIKTVRDLGCKLELKTEDGILGGTIYARIIPVTPKATRGMRLAAEADDAPGRKAIEVRQSYERQGDMLDAARAAIGHALDIAQAALA